MQDFINKSQIDVNYINLQNENSKLDFIQKCEESYKNQINDLVSDLLSLPKIKIVLLTGPSSSGKTTTASNLSKSLTKCGIPSIVVSMDDFFIDRSATPILEDGTYDFENVTTIDIPLFQSFMSEILSSNKAKMPIFDFLKGKRAGYKDIEIQNNEIIIIEGIHALNPIFTTNHEEEVYRVYACPYTNFTLDNNVILHPEELRRMRRMIRDYYHRGMSIDQTLNLWKNVCLGEDKYIKPFKETANFWIDSTHYYEPLVYKKYLPNLLTDSPTSMQIKNSLDFFTELDLKYVPKDSLLWEFLSGLKSKIK